MTLRRALALTLGSMLALPPFAPAADPASLRGTVTTVEGSRVANIDLELVSLDNGALTRARTDAEGAFEARLDPGSYKLEVPKGYTVVRGPRTVALAAGVTTPAEIVVSSVEAVVPPAAGSTAAAGASGKRAGDIVALALFSGALAGVAIYAATNKPPTTQKPPTTSGSR